MQTFLPVADFKQTAKILDYRRLGKQRVEAMQLLNALKNREQGIMAGWVHHPACVMWEGYEDALKYYMNCMIAEWISRGYKNNMRIEDIDPQKIEFPPWLGEEKLHSSHRANLLRKDYEHYSQFGWKEDPQEGYYWP